MKRSSVFLSWSNFFYTGVYYGMRSEVLGITFSSLIQVMQFYANSAIIFLAFTFFSTLFVHFVLLHRRHFPSQPIADKIAVTYSLSTAIILFLVLNTVWGNLRDFSLELFVFAICVVVMTIGTTFFALWLLTFDSKFPILLRLFLTVIVISVLILLVYPKQSISFIGNPDPNLSTIVGRKCSCLGWEVSDSLTADQVCVGQIVACQASLIKIE